MLSLILAVPESITMFCTITSVTVIFFTSLITNFSPNSGQVGVSTSHLLLMRLSLYTSPTLRYVELQLCTALHCFSHCPHRFTSLPAVGYALLPAVGYALLPAVGYALLPAVGYALLPAVGYALASRVLGSLPWLF